MVNGYKVFIRYYYGEVVIRQFRCNSKYDLFAYIGYLYSTTHTKIERIDYTAGEFVVWDMSAGALRLYYKDFSHDSKIESEEKECHE